jgi:hypothetical protein
VRRLGVGGEDEEFIVAFDANSADHNRQVAWPLRFAGNSLGGGPKRIDIREVSFPAAESPEHRMGNHCSDRRPFAHRGLRYSGRERAAGVRKEAAHMDVELVLALATAELR